MFDGLGTCVNHANILAWSSMVNFKLSELGTYFTLFLASCPFDEHIPSPIVVHVTNYRPRSDLLLPKEKAGGSVMIEENSTQATPLGTCCPS